MQRVAVIGLGRFGMALARQLGANGAQVIAVDERAHLVNEIRDDVDVAVRLDATDEHALRSQDIDKVDVVVVAIGENFEASLLTTVLARRLGIPKIICRAQTDVHAEILMQVGASEVIQPEAHTGSHLGNRLANDHIENFIELSEGYTLVELRAPAEFHGKSLKQLELRNRFNVNLVAIKRTLIEERDGEDCEVQKTNAVPRADTVVGPNDVLIVVGSDENLAGLPRE